MTTALPSPGRDLHPEPQPQTRLSAISCWTAACVNGVSKVGLSWHDQAVMAGTVTYELAGVRNASKRIVYNLHSAFRHLLQHDIRKFWRKCAHEHTFTGSAHYFCVACGVQNSKTSGSEYSTSFWAGGLATATNRHTTVYVCVCARVRASMQKPAIPSNRKLHGFHN